MPYVHSFSPVENSTARVLILGSMPSVMSLRKGQYYAHPRNAFWKIMGELVGAGPDVEYEARCRTLKSHGIALWDVLKCCTREGSLDSRIDDSTIETNDLLSFFRVHLKLEHVYFNGAKAEQVYCRKIEPILTGASLCYQRLPSTSPANAAATFADKLRAWQVIVR